MSSVNVIKFILKKLYTLVDTLQNCLYIVFIVGEKSRNITYITLEVALVLKKTGPQ